VSFVSVLAHANWNVFSALGVGHTSVFLGARSISTDNTASGAEQAKNVALVPDASWWASAGASTEESFVRVADFAFIIVRANGTENSSNNAAVVTVGQFSFGGDKAE